MPLGAPSLISLPRRPNDYASSIERPGAGAGAYGLRTLAPRIVDRLLASNEASHIALDSKDGGVTIVKVQTGYASSLDCNMPAAIQNRFYDDGYSTTKAPVEAVGTRAISKV